MTGTLKATPPGSKVKKPSGAHQLDCSPVDYILDITFEIWEQRQVDKIHNYYAEDVQVYSLEGMTCCAADMVSNTHDTLSAFPDRLLLADDVITTGTLAQGFSSHRISSPMTNLGDTVFGSATNRKILTMNIADCEINNGLITREWLARDNLAMIRQLGFDPLTCAGIVAQRFDQSQKDWLAEEYARTRDRQSTGGAVTGFAYDFAERVLKSCWLTGKREALESAYAPYAVLQRAPLHIHSGRDQLIEHFAGWRSALPGASLKVDHVCSQPFDGKNQRIAVRWSVAGIHEGELADMPASGKPVYIVGVTHWVLVDGRIVREWTVFDELAVLAQTLI
jgi:predicted ester cyclase